MENLPAIFETITVVAVVLLILATILLWVFEFRRRMANRALIQVRLEFFVRTPLAAASSYYRDCDLETWLKFRPDWFILYPHVLLERR